MERERVDYLQHFGLSREPFANDPMPGFHFACRAHAEVEQRLLRGPQNGKGLTVLIGGHGSGKTTLLRRLLEALPENRFEAAVMVMVRSDLTAIAFVQRIARLFGVTAPPDDRAAVLGQLAARLAQIQERGLRALAVIDEAHMLTGSEVLEELRGLLSLEGDQGRTLSLVLAGLPSLESRLASQPALLHRVDVKARLEPLDRDSAARYLAERLALARGKPDLLHPTAVVRLYELSGGAPRALNTLADNALHEAFLAGRGAVVVDDVERAAADLAVAPLAGELGDVELLSAVEVEDEALVVAGAHR